MEHRDPRPEEASRRFTATDQAWLSGALFVLLFFLALALCNALDSAPGVTEMYQQSWLARALDRRHLRIEQAGEWLVPAGFAGWCVGLTLRGSWPRLRATLLFGGVVVVVLGLVLGTDAACLDGYRAYDGTCAWE